MAAVSGAEKVVAAIDQLVGVQFADDFLAILNQFKVPENFKEFLLTNECNSVQAYVATTSDPKLFDKNVIDACGLELNFGQKLAARRAYQACLDVTASGGSSSGGAGAATPNKLPPGVEKRLRELWTKLHPQEV